MTTYREPSPAELSLAQLRAERHELAARVAHLSWLRRLVVARTDLEVARLAGVPDVAVAPGSPSLDHEVRSALALAPGDGDLLTTLSQTSRTLDEQSRQAHQVLDGLTAELVSRLAADPSSILAGAPAR